MKKIILFMVASAILFACNKSEIDPINNSIENNVTVKNGILVFKSEEAYTDVIDEISLMSYKEREKWENQIGFISQRTIVDNIIEEENKHDELCKAKYAGQEPSNIENPEYHSKLFNDYLQKGVIRIFNEGTSDEYWDYAVNSLSFIELINEDGLFAIGDTIYQIEGSNIKAMAGRDFSKISLLKQAKSDIVEENIVVKSMNNTLKSYGTSPGYIGVVAGNDMYSWKRSGGGKKGEKRIRLRIFLDVRYYIASTTRPGYQFFHDVYVQCQERNFWRKWKYKVTHIDVAGSWDITAFSNNQTYSNNWSYNANASYLKASINPASGNSAPYQSYFTIYCTNPSPFNNEEMYHEPHYLHYNWTASRSGGSNGLTQILVK